ncbi:NADH-quinone oxidoreductase subunit L [Caldalkalibacillus thermarum TA2.A1]|uniref:NADH-quinone oxidoreductase subunit L n=1 Tax=Caldalkalibacillus thermarum (strain TA2.A1) TaxID=986075 RepID=A0A8X8I9G8_CALTT|nr:NADH-quinone oxidoreductase subunit L [Caldalkalibacillus thermarum]QZT34156.1 NADH-quinone oxidoreductase subunit L [Caldalkalibacillus thermarum TA2.A1]
MIDNVWLIPLFPLAAFVLILFCGRWLKEESAWVGVVLMLGSFILATMTLLERLRLDEVEPVVFEWLAIGDRIITMGYDVTPLNALMLFIVTLVSLLVHIYARGYMAGDDRIAVFYAYLALFTFSMLGLVLSPNLLQVYIFWELVGVCSFLLIGFYYYKPEARAAAKKAFIMTRIGDVGLFVAIILLFWHVGSFEYRAIFDAVQNNELSSGMITLAAVLIFIAAIGKSGQFPLHSWLPDAMEGPTPVSALIHAATMVAAGVYLVAALFPLFSASPLAMDVVAYVGAFTAIFAASIGLVQNDIKRLLAYSTVSQLGYMMLALGAAGYVAGVFHLMTHAFFKALLFLAAGSVIHAVHTQDIRHMGGLFGRMKLTGTLFFIGCLAIAGIPPLSGFFSKEEILLTAWADGRIGVFWVAVVTAFMTAFYMFRLFFMVFTGAPRDMALSKAHESPVVMTLPMIVLGVLSVFGGFVHTHWIGTYLGEWLTSGPAFTYGIVPHSEPWILAVALLVSLAGIGLAYLMYVKQSVSAERLAERYPGVYRTLLNKYYVDEAYQATFVNGLKGLSRLLTYFDRYVVEGGVRLAAWTARAVGALGACMQNGQVQTYGLTVIAGLVVIILAFLLTGGYLG